MADGSSARFAPAVLLGPTMGAYSLEAEAGTRAFGVGILPRGWKALLGVDAEELADQVVDLSALTGAGACSAGEEIRNAPDLATMANAADRYFAALLARRKPPAQTNYPQALEKWLLDPDDLDLDRLIDMMDVSRRQTDRIAKQYFGASPKMLQRKYRALRAADRMLFDGAADWMDAAGPAFYDQSHFIKEFKTFIGATPRQYALNHAELVATVQSKRRSEIVRQAAPIL
jgi:AraC-like DNA-binding protein